MEKLKQLQADKLAAIKSHNNKALNEINAKIFAIREQARKQREQARAEAYERRLQEKAEAEALGC